MPYINLDHQTELLSRPATTAGELNFILTKVCLAYLETNGENYTMFNEVIGALECAKLELYRRLIAPYENQKIHDNGDVYV